MKIEKFLESIKEINEAFAKNIVDNPFYETELWYLGISDVRWCDEGEMPTGDGEFQYSADILKNGIKEIEDWTAFYISDDCGNRYWAVFKNENRIRDIE